MDNPPRIRVIGPIQRSRRSLMTFDRPSTWSSLLTMGSKLRWPVGKYTPIPLPGCCASTEVLARFLHQVHGPHYVVGERKPFHRPRCRLTGHVRIPNHRIGPVVTGRGILRNISQGPLEVSFIWHKCLLESGPQLTPDLCMSSSPYCRPVRSRLPEPRGRNDNNRRAPQISYSERT